MLTIPSWREIILISQLHPHNALFHFFDGLLIENRTKQWNLEQILQRDWAPAQHNAPLTREFENTVYVPLYWGVFLNFLFFSFFSVLTKIYEKVMS